VQCVKVHKFWENQTKFQKINHFGFHRLEFEFEIGMGQYGIQVCQKVGNFFHKFCNLLKIHELYTKILNENTWAVYG